MAAVMPSGPGRRSRVAVPWLAMSHGGLKLEIAEGGWRLSSGIAQTRRVGDGEGDGEGDGVGKGSGGIGSGQVGAGSGFDARWVVASGIMLRVHGYDAVRGRYWSGTFKGGAAAAGNATSPEREGQEKARDVTIAGLGKCRVISVAGTVVPHEASMAQHGCALDAVVEFALTEGGEKASQAGEARGGAMAWRATVVNSGSCSMEVDTVTMMEGMAVALDASPHGGGAGGGGEGGRGGGEGSMELWATLATGGLLLLTCAARGAITQGALYVGLFGLACVCLAASLVLPVGGDEARHEARGGGGGGGGGGGIASAVSSLLGMAQGAGGRERGSGRGGRRLVWRSVSVNGWQSFSYAGRISLARCCGPLASLWRALYLAGLWWLNPQVGGFPPWLNPISPFSAAFHEGGTMPPLPWWRYLPPALHKLLPACLKLPAWREAAAIRSDMYAVIAAGGETRGSRRYGGGGGVEVTCVVGMLAQREQFCTVAVDPWEGIVAVHASCDRCLLVDGGGEAGGDGGGRLITDWAVVRPQEGDGGRDPLEWYCGAVGTHCGARVEERVQQRVPVGWCSWYEHMHKVTLAIMRSNASEIGKAGKARGPVLHVQQLDDGYASAWGDWATCDAERFPGGLDAVADEAQRSGLTPGLWLAPFSADAGSCVAREHPEWVLRRRSWLWRGSEVFTPAASYVTCLVQALMGRQATANTGFTHPGKWFYGLDVTHPECRDHVHAMVRGMREVGFTYLKLDFLHSAALAGKRFDPRVTRAQAMQLAMRTLREAVGDDGFLMACSCPLGSAVGWADAARVSADTAERWGAYPLFWDRTNAPSARNAVRNTIARQAMHRRWFLNNPDCLVMRDGNGSFLSQDEVRGCVSVSCLSGGLLFMSDDLASLSPSRLHMASTLFPHAFRGCYTVPNEGEGECSEVLVHHLDGPEGPWTMVALCNWTGRTDSRAASLETLGLAPSRGQVTHAFEWWQGSCSRGWASTLSSAGVPAHSARLYALRVRDEDEGVYLGSDIHISCGKELVGWKSSSASFEAQLDVGREAEGKVYFFIPSDATPSVSGTGYAGEAPTRAGAAKTGTWSVRVRVMGTGSLVVNWQISEAKWFSRHYG